MTDDLMIDNAATASQNISLLDDPATREAIILNVTTPLRKEISDLREAMQEACDLLAERKYGSPARSPNHNARVTLEWAMKGGEA